MTPNQRRLTAMDDMIERFKPDGIIEVVLQFCHTYNVEAHKIERHAADTHDLPYLKIETDYGQSDIGQLKTRIEAFMEVLK